MPYNGMLWQPMELWRNQTYFELTYFDGEKNMTVERYVEVIGNGYPQVHGPTALAADCSVGKL